MGILSDAVKEYIEGEEISSDDWQKLQSMIINQEIRGDKAKAIHKAGLLAAKQGRITPSPQPTFADFRKQYPNDLCLKAYWIAWQGPFLRDIELMIRHHKLRIRYLPASLDDPERLSIIRYFGAPRQGEQPEILYSGAMPPSGHHGPEIEDWARPDFPTNKPGVDKVISWLSYSDEEVATINDRKRRYQEMLDTLKEYFTRWPIEWEVGPEVIQKLKQKGSLYDGVWNEVWSKTGTGLPVVLEPHRWGPGKKNL